MSKRNAGAIGCGVTALVVVVGLSIASTLAFYAGAAYVIANVVKGVMGW